MLEGPHNARTAADLIAEAEALGIGLAEIDPKAARGFREIEEAADLERGSVLESLVESSEFWWQDNGPEELASWIEGGYGSTITPG